MMKEQTFQNNLTQTLTSPDKKRSYFPFTGFNTHFDRFIINNCTLNHFHSSDLVSSNDKITITFCIFHGDN